MKWTLFARVLTVLSTLLATVPFTQAQTAEPSADSNPKNLVNAGGILYFAADDSQNGEELWKSDGTAAGTVMVEDIQTESLDSAVIDIKSIGDKVFFSYKGAELNFRGMELWTSDGSEGGTFVLRSEWSEPADPNNMTEVDGELFFNPFPRGSQDHELWKSDGTVNGTVLLENFDIGMHAYVPNHLTNVGGTLFFIAGDEHFVNELWKTGGSVGGATLVKILVSGNMDSDSHDLTAMGNTLFFSSADAGNGAELWRSDGTAGGTAMLKDIRPGALGSDPTGLAGANGLLFFAADDGQNGRELWKSDGTAGGTSLVLDIRSGATSSAPAMLTSVGGSVFFVANNNTNGDELWISDGTGAGTMMLKDIVPGSTGSNPDDLTAVNGVLFFTADDGQNGRELWKSDGTGAGTVPVKDILGGPLSSNPKELTDVDGTLFFSASNGLHGVELWKSDGTDAGTVEVKNINTTPPTFRIIGPNGGEIFESGDTIDITWSLVADSLVKVQVELIKDNVVELVIASSTDNDGIHSWTIPITLPRGSDYGIHLFFVDNPFTEDISDSGFTIDSPPPVITSVKDDAGGNAFLQWTNITSPPAQYLGIAYDLYLNKFVDKGQNDTIWYAYPSSALEGLMKLDNTGAFFVWLYSQHFDGSLQLADNPATVLMFSGIPHTPNNVTATDIGGNQVELKWDPDIYGTWLYWIIAYEFNGISYTPVITQGPLGSSFWHYVIYSSPDFNSGGATLTVPASNAYFIFIAAMNWDAATWSEFASPFVLVAP